MRRFAQTRSVRRLSAALVGAALVLGPLAQPAAADSGVFGSGSGTSEFGQDIIFSQAVSGSIKSASILIRIPNDSISLPGIVGPAMAAVGAPADGELTYSLDTSTASVPPFAPVEAQFEVVLPDGTVSDGPEIKVIYADDRFTWQIKVGKVVRLHYIDASDSFAQTMLDLADGGVTKAASLFGVTETKPIDYYVYPSQSSFQQGLSEPGTVGGVALPSYRTCFAIVQPDDDSYAADVMPHEPTHIVFSDATGNPYHDPPRWLNEGFAQYVAQGYDSSSRLLVEQSARDGTMPSLLALTNYFPLDSDRIYLAYAESVAAVDLLVSKFGRPAVLKLVAAYGKGDSDDEAFKAALGVDVAGFAADFMAANDATSQTYGPQPEPASPGTASSDGSGSSGPGGLYLLAALMAVSGLILLMAAARIAVSARGRAAR